MSRRITISVTDQDTGKPFMLTSSSLVEYVDARMDDGFRCVTVAHLELEVTRGPGAAARRGDRRVIRRVLSDGRRGAFGLHTTTAAATTRS